MRTKPASIVASTLALVALSATLVTPAEARLRPVTSLQSTARASGAARFFSGQPKLDASTRALRGEAKVRAVLAALAPETRGLELVKTSSQRFGDGDEIVAFGQTFRGLPMIGFSAAVRLDAEGDAVFSTVNLATTLPSRTTPVLSKVDAARVVGAKYKLAVAESDVYPVVASTWEGARLAYVILPREARVDGARPRFVIDAEDGAVLEARDMRTFATAQVYPSNPEKSKTPEMLPFAIDPAPDKLENPFLLTFNCVDKKEVKNVAFGTFSLKAHVCSLQQLAKPNTEGSYVYAAKDVPDPASGEDEYSEVSMYYHATRAYDFFRKLQGSADAQVVSDKPLRTIANLRIASGLQSGDFAGASNPDKPLDPFQNAFFSPKAGGLGDIFGQIYGFSDGAMWFGQGPRRDYSYDGDVVYHEFTHAVVDDTLKLEAWTIDAHGALAAPGAMNEGLADYFSSAITGDPDVGEYASQDISAGLKVIRTLDNKDTCENAIVGEVHYDSTLFSGALWSARSKLPEADRNKFDAALYKSMRNNAGRGRVSYTELANLFLATVGTDLPAAKPLLEAAFTERKVLPSCSRVLELGDKPLEAPQGPSSPGAFAAPGKSSLGVRDTAPGLVQVHAKVPTGSKKGTFSFSIADRGGGGGSPFGNGGKEFTPVVFVKFGSALTWTTTGRPTVDADLTLPLEAKAESAEIEIPEGTTDVFVQIGNAGDQDGYYGGLTLAFDKPAVTPVAPSTPAAPAPVAAEDSSGGCSVPASGSAPASAGLFGTVGAALAALVLRRRRRA